MLQDVRYALRGLLGNRGFAAAAIITLALGIGATVAAFSAVDTILLRALPYHDVDRIVVVWGREGSGDRRGQVSFTDVADFRAQNHSLEAIATFTQWRPVLTGRGEPQRIPAALVGDGYFKVMGGAPALGRVFLPEEQQDGRDQVVVLSYALWQSRFAGDPGVIGGTVVLNGRPHTVVGVMPADFRPLPASLIDQPELLYRPVAERYDEAMRSARHLRAVARLRPGVSLETAATELASIAGRLERERPESNAGQGVRLVSLREDTVGGLRPALLLLFGAVGLVLLIGCANVANLLLARGAARRSELAIRGALGATRGRLLRQALTESWVLAAIGGALGVILALWATSMIQSLAVRVSPLLASVAIDLRVLAFTLALTLICGLAFGFVPALGQSRLDPAANLREGDRGAVGGRRSKRTRGGLVVTEIALALAMVIAAALLARSLLRLTRVPPGFDERNVLTMNVWLPSARYPEAEDQLAFFDQLRGRAASLPGVERVGFTSTLPFSGSYDRVGVRIEGRTFQPGEEPDPDRFIVTPDYLQAMRIPLIEGRSLDESDDADAAPVILISETMASRLWPDGDALGRRVMLPYSTAATNPWRTVVGVVGDVRQYGLDRPGTMQIYLPLKQYPWPYMTIAARTRVPPLAAAADVRRQIRSLDPQQAVFDVASLESRVAGSIALQRFASWIIGGFAVLALVLALVGIYGVVTYSVALRTREYGLRLALGAQTRELFRLTLIEAVPMIVLGIFLGIAIALALTRTLESLLFQIASTDAASFVAAPALVAAVALAACLVPARRAARLDPAVTLRGE